MGEVTGQIKQTNVGLTQLNKEDAGTWQITGLATYTGPTNVDGGTLIVTSNGAATGSAVTVNNSATYRMTGSSAAFKNAGLTLNNTSLASIDASGGNTLTTPALSIEAGARLDLNDNGVIVDYAGATSPIASIRGYLVAPSRSPTRGTVPASCRLRQTRTHRIFMASATPNSLPSASPVSWVRLSTISRPFVLRYTKYGDNNLDGTVDIGNDFAMLLDGLAATNASSWIQGDYTYDNKVDLGNDFNLFFAGYLSGKTLRPRWPRRFSAHQAPERQHLFQSRPSSSTRKRSTERRHRFHLLAFQMSTASPG